MLVSQSIFFQNRYFDSFKFFLMLVVSITAYSNFLIVNQIFLYSYMHIVQLFIENYDFCYVNKNVEQSCFKSF